MKKFLFAILFLAFTVKQALAVTSSPTPAVNLQEQLLSKIASKVAELNLVEKRGIIGKVDSVSDSQITLIDLKGNTRFVDVDELTKFISSSSKSFGISDITKGSTLGILGLYNKQSGRILARDVTAMSDFPKIIYGLGVNVDKTNYELTIVKASGEKVVIEIQDITKTYSYSYGGNTLTKSGFSKIQTMQTVIAIGFPDANDPNKVLATRVLLFPDINAQTTINVPPDLPTIQPSTGSGIKLYPLSK
jgi:hypothetical protein